MKRYATSVLIGLAILVVAVPAAARTVVYHDSARKDATALIHANMMLNLAAHFDADIDVRPVAQYRAGQIATYHHVIYVGVVPHRLPRAFLAEAVAAGVPLLWIGRNFDQLDATLSEPTPLGFRYVQPRMGENHGWILYHDRRLARALPDRTFHEVTVTGNATVYSEVAAGEGDAERFPHFVRGGNVCFLAENPFYSLAVDDRQWVLADLLHEFYRTGAGVTRRALVRFEDIKPRLSDPALLKQYADEFAKRGVPFAVGVTPIFTDPTGRYFGGVPTTVTLADDPELVDALRYLVARGGVLVMHGTTHQHGEGITSEDWEFTEGPRNEPAPGDKPASVRARVERGLTAFAAVGWRPRVWETPHYAATEGDFHVFADYFDAMYERPLVYPVEPSARPVFGRRLTARSQMLPYETLTGEYGMRIIPENLGALLVGNSSMTPDALLARADALAVVRDGIPSFYFHHNGVPMPWVLAVVDGLRERGYTFVSAAEFAGDDDLDLRRPGGLEGGGGCGAISGSVAVGM